MTLVTFLSCTIPYEGKNYDFITKALKILIFIVQNFTLKTKSLLSLKIK